MLALAVSFVTLSYTALIFLAETAHDERLRQNLRLEIERAARISGEVLSGVLWSLNKESVSAGLEVMLTHDDVVAAIAYDSEGNFLVGCQEVPVTAEDRETAEDPDSAENPPPAVDCKLRGGTLRTDLDAADPVIRAILHHDGRRVEAAGEIHVYYTEARLDEESKNRLERDALVFLVLILSLLAGILLATHRAVLTPLARWRQALRSSDDVGLESVDWTSADEIGMLIREYNEKVGEERAKAERLTERLKKFEDAFESLRRGFCIFDRDFRLVAYNRSYRDILDHDEGTIESGISLSSLLRANAARGEYGSASVDAVIIDRLAIASSNESYRRLRTRPDGTVIEVDSYPTAEGGFVSIYTDVTEQKNLEIDQRKVLLDDTVTGLPNRSLFHDRLRQALALTDRHGTGLAVHLVDLDHFQRVNEYHDEDVGDEVLREVAERIRHIVRKSDTVARLEGDRFAVIQQDLASVDDAALLAHRLVGAVSRTFEIGVRVLRLTASIGISVYPDDDRTSGNLLKNAHLALAAAKAEGRNRYRFFVPEVDREVARRRQEEEEIFTGLREGQFVLRFVPRLELATGALVGAEAVAFWQHPERGLLPPCEFRNLVEKRGLAVPLTDWMLEEACRQRLAWQAEAEGLFRVTVSLSSSCFEEGDVALSIRSALGKTSLDHHFLEVEISADALDEAPEKLAVGVHELREMGVTLILGAVTRGNLPFHTIRCLPVDALRIGRELIGNPEDAESAAIVRAVIGLAQRLDLRVSAAGVETAEQLRRLKDEGCDEVQGEIVSGPLTGDQLTSWWKGRSRGIL